MKVSRHDHHNLEIQTHLPPVGDVAGVDVDLYLFIPTSLRGSRWSKTDLAHDFRSRARLALPATGSHAPGAAHTLDQTRSRILALFGRDPVQDSDFRRVGAWVADLLKHQAVQHRRQYRMAHALNLAQAQRAREILRLKTQVAAIGEFLSTIRKPLGQLAEPHPVAALLEEYISNFQVQYLDTLSRALWDPELSKVSMAADVSYRQAHLELETLLGQLRRMEAAYRIKFSKAIERARTPADRERAVLRLGQLKKYFQSPMFLQVCRHQPSNRFVETTAIAATALAGLVWALVQGWGAGGVTGVSGNPGAWMVALVVLAYVLRDRLKDRAKVSLQRRVQRWLPDLDLQLQVNGSEIGTIREWFRLEDRGGCSESIRRLRMGAATSPMEECLGEEVLHLRKQIALRSTGALGHGWALQENTRVNLERYLKFMDDPLKRLAILDADGSLSHHESRKVYHFYVLAEVRPQDHFAPADRATRQLVRVVLDKNGIDRLEPC